MLNYRIYYLILFLFITSCSEGLNINNNSNTSEGYLNQSLDFKGTENSLDIVTWNIENYPKNNSLTNNYLLEIIDSLNVDIFALQEIESTNEFNTLASSLGDNWTAFRSENSHYGELSYLINTNEISITEYPYTILNNDSYYFAYREPYIVEFEFNNKEYILINIHFKCCNGSEERRRESSILLKEYIDNYFSESNVIIVGDFNDEIIDTENVFDIFLDDNENYEFTDMPIAQSPSEYWSYPSFPSHIDHIVITNELFNNHISTSTILIENALPNLSDYNNYISDHRPVGIKLSLEP